MDGFRHRLTKAVARVMPDDTQAERDKRIIQEFVTKLRREIKSGMALQKFTTLEEATEAANKAERQTKILYSGGMDSFYNQSTSNQKASSSTGIDEKN